MTELTTLFRAGAKGILTLVILVGVFSVVPRLSEIDPTSLWSIAEQMFPPRSEDTVSLLTAMNETLLVALVGTFLGFGVALLLVLGFEGLSERTIRLLSVPVWFSRGVPDVVYAVLLVQVFGLGPITGVLALALGTFGVSGKLLLDAFQVRSKLTEVVFVRSGMSRVRILLTVVLPSLYREILGQFVLRLEINFRIAIVIGLVGGGGLGLQLDRALGTMDYRSASMILLAIAIFVFGSESVARIARNHVAASTGSMLNSRVVTWTPIGLAGLSVFYIILLITEGDFRFSAPQALKLTSALVQPDFISQASAIGNGLIESASLAAFSAFIVFPSALGVAVLSSVAATGRRKTSFVLRQIFGIARGVPVAVLSLFLVVPFGLGPQTAFLALVIGGTLFIGRIAADFLDNTSGELAKLITRAGASKALRAVVVLAQNRSRLLRLWYFTLDFTFRYSVILGILGSGGLGTVILNAIRVQDLSTVSAATILILSVVASIELAQRVAGKETMSTAGHRK